MGSKKEEKIKQEILEYYKSDKFTPILPSMPSFRHFRGKNIKGAWRKCPRRIRRPEQLKNWMIKEKIIDCYHSTSTWLDPLNIAAKNTKNILIGANLVFDVDINYSKQGFKKALSTAKKLFLFVSPEYKLETFSFTGMKGFRLVFFYKPVLPADPKRRVGELEKNRKIYISRTLSKIEFDKECLIDVYRIIRVVGTAHGKTGLICTKLPEKDLFSPFEAIWKKVRSAVPNPVKFSSIKKKERKKARINAKEQKTKKIIKYFITNQDGKRYVPFFKYLKKTGCIRELKRLHKTYDIGPIWLFEDEEYILGFGIRTFQKRRLTKIYAASRSVLKNQFNKYHRQYFQVLPELKFIKMLPFETKAMCSRAHANYLHSREIFQTACPLDRNENTIVIKGTFRQ